MFLDDSPIEIVWSELSNLSKQGVGVIKGYTRVDAYVVENKDVSDYIDKREAQYHHVKTLLEAKGMEVTRAYAGSEDGEAILYRQKNEQEWHFFTHMDPLFVEEKDNESKLDC